MTTSIRLLVSLQRNYPNQYPRNWHYIKKNGFGTPYAIEIFFLLTMNCLPLYDSQKIKESDWPDEDFDAVVFAPSHGSADGYLNWRADKSCLEQQPVVPLMKMALSRHIDASTFGVATLGRTLKKQRPNIWIFTYGYLRLASCVFKICIRNICGNGLEVPNIEPDLSLSALRNIIIHYIERNREGTCGQIFGTYPPLASTQQRLFLLLPDPLYSPNARLQLLEKFKSWLVDLERANLEKVPSIFSRLIKIRESIEEIEPIQIPERPMSTRCRLSADLDLRPGTGRRFSKTCYLRAMVSTNKYAKSRPQHGSIVSINPPAMGIISNSGQN